RVWCGSRSVSRASTTSWPTWSRVSPPRSRSTRPERPIRKRWRRSRGDDVTIFDTTPVDMASIDMTTVDLPTEGEVGVVKIGALTLENGAVIEDVSIALQRWGELS